MPSSRKTSFALKIFLRFLGIVLVIPALLGILFRLVNHTNGAIVTSGRKRKFLLYVPKSYDPSQPTPLVITIHGFAQWPAHQMQISRWNQLADEQGFIAVYPAGTQFPMRWNSYGRPGSPSSEEEVQFIADMIGQLEQKYNIDSTRVYVNGLSNGAGMTVLLSCRLSERIAAIGCVGGAYLLNWSECKPTRRVPMIVFHGTADPVVPFGGGRSQYLDQPFPPIRDWVAETARSYGCSSQPEPLPKRGAVSGICYSNGKQNTEIVFYTIEGGGHTWPGGGWIPYWIAGSINKDIDATRMMWDFFKKHPL